jgi:hypothetical protein
VVRRPRVAVASTGDELREPGAALPPGSIYESNRYTLIGLLRRLGCAATDLGILPDRRDAVLPALRYAAAGPVAVRSGPRIAGRHLLHPQFRRLVVANLGRRAGETAGDCAGVALGDGVDYLPFGGLGVE